MIGPCQPMKRCSPPKRSISSGPGEQQVEGVAEHHLVAERRDLRRQQALDGRLGGQRHEGRGADLAVGGAQRPARAREERVAGEIVKADTAGILWTADGHHLS